MPTTACPPIEISVAFATGRLHDRIIDSDASGIDEAIAELEREGDREDTGSGGPVDN